MANYFITGCTSGIGLEFVNQLHKDHHIIGLARTDFNPHDIRMLKHDLENYKEIVIPEDVLIATDVLILNAGISQRVESINCDISLDEKIMKINYLSNVFIVKQFLPYLMQCKGKIIVISSVVGIHGAPYRTAYSASKHALHGFFESLRAETNIDIQIVCPGFVNTSIARNALVSEKETFSKDDPNQLQGLDPKIVVKKVLNSNKKLLFIGKKDLIGVYLKRFFPSLLDFVLRKMFFKNKQ